MNDRLKQLAPLAAVAVFTGAAWMLWHELQHYRWHDIRQSLASIPLWKVGICLLLTATNYTILIGYDLLALKAIQRNLPLRSVAFASFTGFVASYNFGATFGGVPIRYRIYSSLGLSALEIMRLTLMLGVTFWIGEIGMAGLSFVLSPISLPESLGLPMKSVFGLGWVLLAMTVGYIALTAFFRKPLHFRGMEFQLPTFGMTLAQIGLAALDLLLAAGCLYVLMPDQIGLNYIQFLGIFLLAVIAVILTHVPGGLGVFELVIMTLTDAPSNGDVLAALLAFRLIYYLVPLLIASLMMAGQEYLRYRSKIDPVLQSSGQMLGALTPTILSMAAMISGVVLLISGATPSVPERMNVLAKVVSLPVVEISHFVGSLAGAALLIVAWGLKRRLDAAWWSAMVLLGVGVVTSLLKGFDVEEAIILSVVMLALYFCRDRFYRKGALLHEKFTVGWLSAIAIAAISALWLGFFIYKNVDYRNDLWWNFAIHGDAPRYMRASVGAAGLLLIFSIWKLFSPAKGLHLELPNAADLEDAARIVSSATATNANLALLGDKRFLFNKERTAFIMYAVENHSWIAMGSPVGPRECWADLIWRYIEQCDIYHGRPVFYQVDPDALPFYLDHGLTLLKLGEEGRVDAQGFTLEGSHFQGLRSGRKKMEKAGCVFEVISQEDVPSILPRLKEISDAWMAEKHAAEKGFSLGFFDDTYLRRYPCAVVKVEEQIVAFANLWLGAEKEEFSVDLMRYDPTGPRGIMDYLFIELILWGKANGYQWFSMGMAPLSGIEDRPLAPMWNKAIGIVYKHGGHFYSFDGLRQYKNKFRPVWQPKYLASPGGLALPEILTDLTRLIGRERHPESLAENDNGLKDETAMG